jgi:glycine/D-amino acid oxidase-like deaminating enzyme
VKENTYDVIFAGGGVMGCAAAYYLSKADASLTIAVIEKDPTYEFASTPLSLANVRIQFSLKENILISKYGMEMFARFDEDMVVDGILPYIDYKREGNLFLVAEEDRDAAIANMELQRQLGGRVEWWSPDRIKQHYPLYQPAGLAGGAFGPLDGHLDAYSALMAYKRKAASVGVTFIEDRVTRIDREASAVTGVTLASRKRLKSGTVINSAGAWAAELAETAGIDLPVQPVKRQVFALDTAVKPDTPLPLTNLPSGLYFRTDTGNQLLVGKSLPEDPAGIDFTWQEERFNGLLWPELAGFVPAFDRLKLLRGWAGLYAVNTFDGNAILGEWPDLKGFFLVNGFSGHGFQQAPAVGRYLSELILKQKPALDLSIFRPERIMENKPLSETGLV